MIRLQSLSGKIRPGRFQPGRESKMAADTKISKAVKINFFSRTAWYIWLKFCMEHNWELGNQ